MNERREKITLTIWIYNIIALIVLTFLLATSCAPAPDCEYTQYEVTWRNVAGQEESRIFYLPEEIYTITPELVDGYPAMVVKTPCGEWIQQIGVIDVLGWVKRDADFQFSYEIADSIILITDTTTWIYGN